MKKALHTTAKGQKISEDFFLSSNGPNFKKEKKIAPASISGQIKNIKALNYSN